MRKILFFLSIFALLLTNVGCQKVDDTDVVIWHWMSDRHEIFQELASQYSQETGINVNFRLFPHVAYTQRIDAAAAADDLPDLFGILGEKRVLASFAKETLIEDLTPHLAANNNKWKNRFIDITLEVNSFEPNNIYQVKPGTYGIPIDAMSIQFLYNKSLLQEAGLDPKNPPQTFDEFLLAIKSASQMPGVYGFTSGWGETWMLECLATNYAFDVMGKDKFFATIKGEVAYTDPDWIKVFSVFKNLEKTGELAPDIDTLNNKEAEVMFATERSIFTFNGSWGVNTYQQINPELEYAAMLPPQTSAKHKPGIWAGAGASFVLNANSKNKEEAIDFLRWLTQKEQQKFLTENTNNLPAISGLDEYIEDNLKAFADNQEYFTHPRLWPKNENPRVVEALNRGIQNIIIGAKTPQEVAEQVNKIKQRQLGR